MRRGTFQGVAMTITLLIVATAPASVSAQRPWSGGLSVGYAHGIGGDFGGNGSVNAVGSLFRPVAGVIDVGVEVGYHRLGTNTTRLPDLYGPGSTYREDFGWTVWQAGLAARLRPAEGRWRPYALAGSGAYVVRSRDVIEVRDASGAEIPGLQFRQTRTEVKPGVSLGAGIERLATIGRLAVGLHARWHGVLAGGGVADFFTITMGLGLD
ncbi:MAG TPA: hypothetical protein VFU46_11620 [Gemmatimonadales bacterium]|nr:hypothetical protein [Gemmatimonadales bacterium]